MDDGTGICGMNCAKNYFDNGIGVCVPLNSSCANHFKLDSTGKCLLFIENEVKQKTQTD